MTHGVILLTSLFFVVSGQSAAAQCSCISPEGRVKEGETACISSVNGRTLARCEKVLNVTSWKLLDEACPQEQSLQDLPQPVNHRV
jgi:hypothetical protein